MENMGVQIVKFKRKDTIMFKFYPYVDDLQLRTTQESLIYAQEAYERKAPVFGVKGPSTLNTLVPDYINFTAIDSMHCVF